MVGVAQLVELLVVVQAAAGSSPVTHPTRAASSYPHSSTSGCAHLQRDDVPRVRQPSTASLEDGAALTDPPGGGISDRLRLGVVLGQPDQRLVAAHSERVDDRAVERL